MTADKGGGSVRDQIPVHQPLTDHPGNHGVHLVDGVSRAVIMPPRELVDVAAQVFLAHVVVGAVVAPLQQRPRPSAKH